MKNVIFKKITPVDLYVDLYIMDAIFEALSNLRSLRQKHPKDYNDLHTSSALILARRVNPPKAPSIQIPEEYKHLTLAQLDKRYMKTTSKSNHLNKN